MKFLKENEINEPSNNTLIMEHKGVRLAWSTTTYRTLKVNDDLVNDINKFWARLPEDVQDKIFACYIRAYDAFEEIERTSRLDEVLLDVMKDLFDYHPFEQIMNYINLHSSLKWPTDLNTRYHDDNPKQLTYLKEEYYNLIGFALLMKVALPIWGNYIDVIAKETGGTYKEYRAAALLNKTNVLQTPAYKRLRDYVETFWDGNVKPHSSSAVIAGLDAAQVPSWLIGNVLVRRIATAELIQSNSLTETKMLVALIYNFVKHLSETMDKQFGGRVTDKGIENAIKGDDDNTSVIENYKIKADVPEGIILTHEIHLIQKPLEILQILDPTCPVELYLQYSEMIDKGLGDFEFTKLSKTLVQWILHPIVTARIIDYVNYHAVMSMYKISYTLLKHWGYDQIAMMIFAQPVKLPQVYTMAKHPITIEQIAKLDELYVDAPQDTRKRQRSKVNANVATHAIGLLLADHYGFWWQVPSWDDYTNYPDLHHVNGKVSLPQDIEPNLADLIIHLKTKIHPGKGSIVRLHAQQQPVS